MRRTLAIVGGCSVAAAILTIAAVHLALLFGGDAIADTLVPF